MASIESPQDLDITLYGYYSSSCSGRARLALAFKNLPYHHIIHSTAVSYADDSDFAKLNPSKTVPVLIVRDKNDASSVTVIRQSWAILEYLEELNPNERSLMPVEIEKRTIVRELAMIILSDTQPLTSPRVTRRLDTLGIGPEEQEDWIRHFFARGIRAYEDSVTTSAGKYSVGDQITLADLCLIPAVWKLLMAGMKIDEYPTVKKIYENMDALPEVKAAHWSTQPDTPDVEKRS